MNSKKKRYTVETQHCLAESGIYYKTYILELIQAYYLLKYKKKFGL